MNKTSEEQRNGKTGLRQGCLSFIEVLGQSIANIAPTATPAITISVVFALAGNGTWLAYLLATIAVVFLSFQINVFSKRSATPGALYSYTVQGLGQGPGFISGCSLILAYLMTASAVMCGFVTYANSLLAYAGIQIPSAALILIGFAAAWLITYKGVELSARVMLVIEMASVSLIIILAAVVLVSHGFNLGSAQFRLKGVSFSKTSSGLVFALFSFVGFESAATMGREAKNPLKNIPKAVTSSSVFVGGFFVIMSLIMVMGFSGCKTSLGESTAPLAYLAEQSHVGALGVLISFGAMISFWSCGVASITAAARLMLTMSKQGFLPKAVSKCHKKNYTPYVATTICAVIVAVVPLFLFAAGNSVMDVYDWTGTISVMGFLVSYILITIAAQVHLYRLKQIKAGGLISAAVVIVLLGMALISNVFPSPAYPANLIPIIFILWLIASLVWYIIAIHYSVTVKKLGAGISSTQHD